MSCFFLVRSLKIVFMFALDHRSLRMLDFLFLQMKRLYGRYLRSESYRKSLVYQKKYILALLNGFQDTEEDTLRALARMGGFPDGQSPAHSHKSPLLRFRSAARTVIAMFRSETKNIRHRFVRVVQCCRLHLSDLSESHCHRSCGSHCCG